MSRIRSSRRTAFETLDGSSVTELVHPARDAAVAQSLALAEVAPGATTRLHRHRRAEEVYHILEGEGEMRLGDETFAVAPGDSVVIRPGTAHRIANTGAGALRFFCCCAPAYADTDTELLDD
jgi:mannose-6-phosphate isomerase-like protein (cupin superfamily)